MIREDDIGTRDGDPVWGKGPWNPTRRTPFHFPIRGQRVVGKPL